MWDVSSIETQGYVYIGFFHISTCPSSHIATAPREGKREKGARSGSSICHILTRSGHADQRGSNKTHTLLMSPREKQNALVSTESWSSPWLYWSCLISVECFDWDYECSGTGCSRHTVGSWQMISLISILQNERYTWLKKAFLYEKARKNDLGLQKSHSNLEG